jgi:MFS family permease
LLCRASAFREEVLIVTVLRNRDFALYWAAGVINALGDYVLIAALPFYVYRASGSVLLTSVMFMGQMVPPVVFGSVAGVYVDRWDRRRTLVIADLALALVLLPLLAIRGTSLAGIALAVVFLEATFFQFVPPAAGALLTSLVSTDRLAEANAVRSTGFNAAVLIGPSLGGLLANSLGLSAVVLADVASYAAAGLCVLLVRAPERLPGGTSNEGRSIPRFWAEWIGGVRAVRSHPLLRGLFCVQALSRLGAGIVWVTLIIFIRGTLHAGTAEYGWWLSLNAVGGLGGSFLAGFLVKRLPPRLLIPSGLAGQGLIWFVIVGFASLPVLLICAPLMAICGVVWSVSAGTTLQQEAEQGYLGRVLGAYGTVASLSVLIGLGAAGALAGKASPGVLLRLAAALELLAGLSGIVTLRSGRAID